MKLLETTIYILTGLLASALTLSADEIWKDSSQPMDARVDDLIGRMSLAEKVSQLQNDAPRITRLGLPAYNYWNEALHGVANDGIATVFPNQLEGLLRGIQNCSTRKDKSLALKAALSSTNMHPGTMATPSGGTV